MLIVEVIAYFLFIKITLAENNILMTFAKMQLVIDCRNWHWKKFLGVYIKVFRCNICFALFLLVACKFTNNYKYRYKNFYL